VVLDLPGPIKLMPRIDPKIWGGRRLERFGIALPSAEPYGEALLTSSDAVIVNGACAGKPLGEFVASDPIRLLGVRGRELASADDDFPLLIKLIDANTALSVQVHPNDENAPAGSRGKTEAWYVLAARPESLIYVGLNDLDQFDEMVASSRAGISIGDRLRAMPVQPGEAIFIPAGTIHAIGAGVLLYEIQQPSAVTWRFDDWNRVDELGQPRELHVEEAIAVTDPNSLPEILRPVPRHAGEPARPFIACPQFGVEVIVLRPGQWMSLMPEADVSALTCVAGEASVTQDGSTVPIALGETVALVAGRRAVELNTTAGCQFMHGWIGTGALT
jgi:mannose-6-phosphate isomerase